MVQFRLSLIAIASLALVACGDGNIGGQPGPCETAAPPPECSQTCDTANPCPAGYYCAADGTCTADCTVGGGECGSNQMCTADGTCVAGGQDGGSGCPNIGVVLSPEIPTVELVIDQSGSMTQDFGGGLDRWEAVEEALVGSQGIVTTLQDRIIFGATMYSSIGGSNGGNNGPGGVCPMLQSAPAQFNNLPAINQLFVDNSPQADTPTAESINAVTAGFPAPDPERPGPRIILLATDGNPDDCTDPDTHGQPSRDLSEAAVQAAYAVGLNTFVLSVGDQVAQTHLQRLASAGVGDPLTSTTAPYYVANNPGELVDAFNDIIRGVRSCRLMVNGTVDLSKASEGNVRLNGMNLVFGTDWIMLDETTMELLGTACDTFLNADQVDFDADFPCGAVVL